MDKLSQELIDNIVSFLPRRVGEEGVPPWEHRNLPFTLPALTAVSRGFQRAVERRTFQELNIKTSDEELSEFERILIPRRQSSIRTLHVVLLVSPCPSEAEDGRENYYETDRDRQTDKAVATAQLRRLWEFLGGWSETFPNVTLNLDTAPSPDVPDENGDGLQPFTFSLLDLTDDVESFPALPWVHSVDIRNSVRYWNPRVPLVLTSRMPEVQHVYWALDESRYDWGRYYVIDKQYRDGLVEGIRAVRLPSSVRDFSCLLKPVLHREPGQELPRFVEEGAHDPVSCAIRELTRDCTNITLKGPFHPSLFDPPKSGPAAEEQPYWQQTASLHVEMGLCSPDGSWLFLPRSVDEIDTSELPEGLIDYTQLPPGYADAEQTPEEVTDYFEDHQEAIVPRSQIDYHTLDLVPNEEKLNALLAAFARGCARMPALEIANLRIDYDNDDNWPFQVVCVAALHRLEYWDVDKADDPKYWRVYIHAHNWRPTEATIAQLKNIGVERNGEPSTICFLTWGEFYG
ncbi:hypothetical protein F4825DRAFT_440977 [Nemania diffusa]|nr:hypothetical protein F4825DRAFT_440977 [Nemania diffusa]